MTDKIIFANTQGFQCKKDKINGIVKTHQPLALVVAEHFQTDPKDLDKLEGYSLRAAYCRSSNERGGVAIYIKIGVDYTTRTDLDAYSQKREFEVVSVEIPSRNLVVTAAYRPPSSSKTGFNSKLGEMLKEFNQESKKQHVMAGDFNIDNSKSNRTVRVLTDNGFKFTLNTSTHQYGACLDNFIVDFDPSMTRVLRDKIDKLSDHHPIELILRSSKKDGTAKVSLVTEPWQPFRTSTSEHFTDEYSNYNSNDVDYIEIQEGHKKICKTMIKQTSVSTKQRMKGKKTLPIEPSFKDPFGIDKFDLLESGCSSMSRIVEQSTQNGRNTKKTSALVSSNVESSDSDSPDLFGNYTGMKSVYTVPSLRRETKTSYTGRSSVDSSDLLDNDEILPISTKPRDKGKKTSYSERSCVNSSDLLDNNKIIPMSSKPMEKGKKTSYSERSWENASDLLDNDKIIIMSTKPREKGKKTSYTKPSCNNSSDLLASDKIIPISTKPREKGKKTSYTERSCEISSDLLDNDKIIPMFTKPRGRGKKASSTISL